MRNNPKEAKPFYEIRIRGVIDSSWDAYFNGITIQLSESGDQPPVTTLSGAVTDQSALRGMLNRLWDLNLTLLSVRRIESELVKGIDHE
jgi:hypothetical protein